MTRGRLRNSWIRLSGWCALLAACCSLSSWGQSQRAVARQEEHQFNLSLSKGSSLPHRAGGALIGNSKQNGSDEPVIWTADRSGARKEEISFSFPKARYLSIYSWAAAPNGMLAIEGTALNGDGQGAAFLGIISPDRMKKNVVRLEPYSPRVTRRGPRRLSDLDDWVAKETNQFDVLVKGLDSSGCSFVYCSLQVRVRPEFPRPVLLIHQH